MIFFLGSCRHDNEDRGQSVVRFHDIVVFLVRITVYVAFDGDEVIYFDVVCRDLVFCSRAADYVFAIVHLHECRMLYLKD